MEEVINQISQELKFTREKTKLPIIYLAQQLRDIHTDKGNGICNIFFGVTCLTVKLSFINLDIEPIFIHLKHARNEFSLLYDVVDNKIMLKYLFAKQSFPEWFMRTFTNNFHIFLQEVLNNPKKRITEISLLSSNERNKILFDWNKIARDYPQNQTILGLFAEQVKKSFEKTAVVYERESLSYRELDEQSNQLARYIRRIYFDQTQENLTPDTLIGICVERSLEMVIGIWGILKAGAAYVPLDTDSPPERLHYILSDIQAKLILTQSWLAKKIASTVEAHQLILLDQENYLEEDKQRLEINYPPESLIYVIYTSGTTGHPKGVMIQHDALVNRLVGMQRDYQFNPQDKILQNTPYYFDVSVLELLLPLICGAQSVLMAPEAHRIPAEICTTIHKYEITRLHFVPSMLEAYLDWMVTDGTNSNLPSTLLTVFSSGEALALKVYSQFKRLYPDVGFQNLYGPTETTIDVTEFACHPGIKAIYIGRPVDNTKVYVLDAARQPAPVGVIGELYIGGVQVARGYLNRPELTAERFIANPFATPEDQARGYDRLYKTGDLVRWFPDGNLEYIGRNDFQVKIRGFRIELGEIENNLNDYPTIKHSVIMVHEREGTKSLVAYYVAEKPISDDRLLEHLATKLPDYMIPSVFVHLESLPLTSSGKLDRRALPEPECKAAASYVAPRNELEAKMVEVWQQVLHLQRVGIEDDFFRLGGDSILSIQLTSRLRHLGLSLSVKDIFSYRCIAQLVVHIPLTAEQEVIDYSAPRLRSGESVYTPSDFPTVKIRQELLNRLQDRYRLEDLYPASSLQQGFIYHALTYPEDEAYRLQLLVDYPQAMDTQQLQAAWRYVLGCFPGLRVCFNWEEELLQIITDYREIPWTEHDISAEKNKEEAVESIRAKDWQERFDLSKPGLLRLHWIMQSEDYGTLLLSMHHSITDGWSYPILFQRVHEYYEAGLRGKALSVVEDRAYGAAQRYFHAHQSEVQAYWQERMKAMEQVNDLNALFTQPADLDTLREVREGREAQLSVGGALYHRLKTLARSEGITLNVLLQLAWHKLLQVYTRDAVTVVGTTVSGRGLPIAGIEESVGLYINTLPLIIDWQERTVQAQLGLIHQYTTELNHHSYINLAHLQTAGQRLFHSLFVFENYPIGKAKAAGLKFKLRNAIEKLDYPLCIAAHEAKDNLQINLKYAGEYLSDAQATRLLKQMEKILSGIPDRLYQSHSQLSLLDQAEYEQTVYRWNETDRDYPQDRTILELFAEQVEKASENTAVVYEGESLTYRELNEKSNQLARYIRRMYFDQTQENLTPDTLIGICVERSLEMVIGIWGILKSGAAYVPLDTNSPPERLRYILSDTQTKLILTQSRLASTVETGITGEAHQLILLDQENYLEEDKQRLEINYPPESLVYVIYTSGTTGHPKGVMIQHGALVNRLVGMQRDYQFNPQDKVLQMTPYYFDVSVWELLLPLICGAQSVLMAPGAHRIPCGNLYHHP